VRLLLLADQAIWAATLQGCLAPLGPGFVLVAAADWAAVGPLFDGDANAVLLTTPEHQPGPGQCVLPPVLLVEDRKSTRLNSSHITIP